MGFSERHKLQPSTLNHFRMRLFQIQVLGIDRNREGSSAQGLSGSAKLLCRILNRQVVAQTCCPMPLGFDPPHPGGMTENSPTFQRWGREFRGAQVPKGRLKPCAIRQPSLRDLSCCGRWFPTLKRWAIIACPSGTKTWPGFAGLLWDQILAALDIQSALHLRKSVSGYYRILQPAHRHHAPVSREGGRFLG